MVGQHGLVSSISYQKLYSYAHSSQRCGDVNQLMIQQFTLYLCFVSNIRSDKTKQLLFLIIYRVMLRGIQITNHMHIAVTGYNQYNHYI
jgi:hypothetical protein